MSIHLKQVEDITCSYGILGRIFGFGNLKIESAGTCGMLKFEGIPQPEKKKHLIERKIQKLRHS